MTGLTIAPSHDLAQYRAIFARHGRLHVPGFWQPEAATRVREGVLAIRDWQLFVNHGSKTASIRPRDLEALGPKQAAEMFQRIQHDARTGFQFQYLRHELSEAGEAYAGTEAIGAELVRFLNSEAFLGFARAISGDPELAYADGQVSCYEPGHFLTRHNDLRPELGRRVAYVINLSPGWRAEWGGVLEFLDAAGHVVEGYVPAFNAINLFRVPVMHHVSCVAPFAGAPRLSITGWLRAR